MAERYVPAAGRRGLTGIYDPVLALTMREGVWRPPLVARVLSAGPSTILDLGCGTGTLAVALARSGAAVVGVDGDAGVLERARRKAAAAGVEVDWRAARADAVPLADGAVDAVTCTLLLHHLAPAAKAAALAECFRILAPGGRLHVADWGRPHDPLMRAAFLVLQLIDGFDGTRDHVAGRLPAIVVAAGFAAVRSVDRLRTGWGTLEMLEATR